MKEKKEKSMLTNMVKYATSAVTSAFLFALLVMAGRILGAEDFGKFSFAMAFAFLFKPLIDPKVNWYLASDDSNFNNESVVLI